MVLTEYSDNVMAGERKQYHPQVVKDHKQAREHSK